MSEQCLTIVLSTKPLWKLTGTDRQTGAQDYVLSQADALTKNKEKAKKQEFLGPTYLIQKCFPFPFNLVYFDQC